MGDDEDCCSSSLTTMETEEGFTPVFFSPRPLKNLLLIDELDSLSPIVDMKVADLRGEETPQIYTACGRGPRSSLKILRPGLSVAEMAVSPLPGNPSAVWTVKTSAANAYDSYIVVSFVNATLVLSIGETVEEVSDSGFEGTVPTLAVMLMADDSLLQVTPNGLRHIRADKRINEWKTPGKKSVAKVACNSRQVAIALTGGDLVYFELDNVTGQIAEIEKRELAGDIACLAVGEVPEGLQRSRFLAVGTYDQSITLLSLDPDEVLQPLDSDSMPATPESMMFHKFVSGADEEGGDGSAVATSTTFLNVGLHNGVLVRVEVDAVTGKLTDKRTRFIGSRPVQLFHVKIRDADAMLCLSARPWLAYGYQGRFQLTPLSYETLDHASAFASDQCPEGIVAVANNTLRIIMVERLGEAFNSTNVPLHYTPRRLLSHPKYNTLVVVQADNAALTSEERQALRKGPGVKKEGGEDVEMNDEGTEELLPEEQLGVPKAAAGKWASCIQVLDSDGKSTELIQLAPDQCAVSMCLVRFAGKENKESMLCVGIANGLAFYPRSCQGGTLRLYRFVDEGKRLELEYDTPVDDIPLALAAFQGKLLAGCGSKLRIYDMGKQKLLRKCENRGFPSIINSINVMGDRIYVGDAQESFFYCLYRRSENQIHIFADDIVPRHLTASLHMDYDTMAGADKFGNLYVARLPAEISEQVEDDPSGGRAREGAARTGAPYKLEEVIQYHVGDTVCAMQKATLQSGGSESIIYGTIGGALGAMVPFTSREDVDFFTHLEMHLRQENPPLCGRDHMMYRSYYFPVKDVVDGDLCEQYASLPSEAQRRIAEELDRTPSEVMKKLEAIRNRIL
eukprot:scaffold1954_cov364-Prasinococcus_capsulatus_cf.AAC.4